MLNVSRAVHRVSMCPCGHAEHVGRGMTKPVYVCLECEKVETTEGVILSFVSAESADAHAVGKGTTVRMNKVDHRVVDAVQVRKLNGHVVTPWVRLKLKAVA